MRTTAHQTVSPTTQNYGNYPHLCGSNSGQHGERTLNICQVSSYFLLAYIDMSCTCTDTATLDFTIGDATNNQWKIKVKNIFYTYIWYVYNTVLLNSDKIKSVIVLYSNFWFSKINCFSVQEHFKHLLKKCGNSIIGSLQSHHNLFQNIQFHSFQSSHSYNSTVFTISFNNVIISNSNILKFLQKKITNSQSYNLKSYNSTISKSKNLKISQCHNLIISQSYNW